MRRWRLPVDALFVGDDCLERMATFEFDPALTKGRFSSETNEHEVNLWRLLQKVDLTQTRDFGEGSVLKIGKGEDPRALANFEYGYVREHTVMTYGQRQAKRIEIARCMDGEKQQALRDVSVRANPEKLFGPREALPETLQAVYDSAVQRLPQAVKYYQTFLTPAWREKVAKRENEIDEWYRGRPESRMTWALKRFLIPQAFEALEQVESTIEHIEENGFDEETLDDWVDEDTAYFSLKKEQQMQSLAAFSSVHVLMNPERETSWQLIHALSMAYTEAARIDGSASQYSSMFEDWEDNRLRFMVTDDLWWEDMTWKEVSTR